MKSAIAPGSVIDFFERLPREAKDLVLRYCEQVTLPQDQILNEPGEQVQHAYFPIDSIIALSVGLDEHDALGIALVGSEGMLGTSMMMGMPTSVMRAQVQGPGEALRISAADFQRLRVEVPLLDREIFLYFHALLAQMVQTALCTAFHLVEARLAGWLLMTHDRTHADCFYMTHDSLARMLGVRRSGVSTAAGILQSQKLIRYSRGNIFVLNRSGLVKAACACHDTERKVLDQIAPFLRAGSDAGLQAHGSDTIP